MRPLPLALVAAFAGLVLAHTTTANAQSHICGKYETIAAKLSAQFGEKAVASGVSTNGGAYVEFWASDSRGTWSVVTVLPNGMSCLTSAGRDFQMLPGKLAKGRSPVT
ncbi:MAG: hypothetical protein O3C65_13475 [Proteobacteria bacterium]|nr:hypothetical protein [Pseudomonadota bacterium]MDA1059687.1 hypothetical protein [Pseudomonadota bacterium]